MTAPVHAVDAAEAEWFLAALVDLLEDAVEDGASIGFAHRLGRSTLDLDTRLGDPSARLYRSLGWTFVGSIPRYALSAGGTLDANAIYGKLLAGR